MIKTKKNKCRGTGKTLNHGCGSLVFRYKFGLCRTCFFKWLNDTPEGKDYSLQFIRTTLNKVKKLTPKRKYIKWTDKPFKEMVKYVQDNICNPYIRLRDIENYGTCISSGKRIQDAGHYYPTTICHLRFSPQNIHGQNGSDNRFKGANLLEYKQGLIDRYNDTYIYELECLKLSKPPKLDKSELIRIGKTYEFLMKKQIWCFRHEEFENYKNIINK